VSIPLPSLTPDHIHPILVNFTAALVPASFGSDVLGRIFRKPSLHVAAWWMVLYATVITPFTALAGLLWKRSVGSALPPELIVAHQWLGISIAILLVILALWRWSIYARSEGPGVLYLVFGLLVVLALVWQGTLGGKLVFG
jgi:uncharacterized membrane protein